MITHERLLELLSYEKDTGFFRWRIRRSGPDRVGQIAGTRSAKGYVQVWADGEAFLAHRLAWFYVTGVWPVRVDHKDQNKQNNAWNNLREATGSENMANVTREKKNAAGFKGVTKASKAKVYVARIRHNYKQIYLGCFKTAEEAHAVYCAKALEIFGEYHTA